MVLVLYLRDSSPLVLCQGRGPVRYANSDLFHCFVSNAFRSLGTNHSPPPRELVPQASSGALSRMTNVPQAQIRRFPEDPIRVQVRFSQVARQALIPVLGDPSEVALVFGVLTYGIQRGCTGSDQAGLPTEITCCT